MDDSKLIEIKRRFDFLNKYDETHKTSYKLNEGIFDTDMNGWLNIGVIKDGSNLGAGGDAFLMVNPKYPKTDDFSTFIYRATGYNTESDGSGYEVQPSEYQKQYLQIYDEYRDSYYGELFLGGKKTEEEETKHEMFLKQLDIQDNKVVLKHDSSYRITDGIIKKGEARGYSNNSDVGIYFWGSKERGSDQSNSGKYTYYCYVDRGLVYDFENDMERFGTLVNAFEKYPFVAQYWKGGPEIVVNSVTQVPISYVRDNSNGRIYDSNWEEL